MTQQRDVSVFESKEKIRLALFANYFDVFVIMCILLLSCIYVRFVYKMRDIKIQNSQDPVNYINNIFTES